MLDNDTPRRDPQSPPDRENLVNRYRRHARRATLIAVAACFLALGVIAGVLLSQNQRLVKAGDKEVNSELSSAFVEIARQVEPAVVNISTITQPVSVPRPRNEFQVPRNSIDSFQFGPSEPARRGNGSGVIVDSAGYILTGLFTTSNSFGAIFRSVGSGLITYASVKTPGATTIAKLKVRAVTGFLDVTAADFRAAGAP